MVNHLEKKNALDEFKELLSHWMDAYKWQVCSFFAIKSFKSVRLIFGRIIFEIGEIKNITPKFFIETQNIIAGREILKCEPLLIDQILQEARKGRVAFSEYPFSLMNKLEDIPDFIFHPIYHPEMPYSTRLPSLIISGKDKHESLTINRQLLDWELRSANEPFDNIEDLFIHLGFPGLTRIRDFATFEIVGRAPALISDKSIINNRQASIELKASKDIDANKIKLGCKVFNKSNIERFSVSGDKINWANDDDLLIGQYNHDVRDANLLQVFLSYNELALHSWFINDPQKQINQRYLIHNLFDLNLDILKKLLFGEKDSQNFEEGIALLLNILGFSVSHHGKIKKLQDGPDIIALTPEGNIAVIECTTGLLDKDDKLAKLIQRTNLIKGKLNATYGHLTVQPIIVSKLTRAEVSAHIEEAGKHSIAVMCKEELEELLNRATSYPNPEGLFKEVLRLIPKNEQLSLPNT